MSKWLWAAAVVVAILVLLPFVAALFSGDGASEPATAWDMAASGLFDPTNRGYVIEDGVVRVYPLVPAGRCPTGLGHLASGMDTVEQIEIAYTVEDAGPYWLHVTWNPGGSGKEQFEIRCNGEAVAKSALRDGALTPYEDKENRFKVKHVKGQNSLSLHMLSGDGLHFTQLALTTTREKLPAAVAEPYERAGPQGPNPSLKYPDLASYESAIGEPGVLLERDHVWLFAPKTFDREARVILAYLVKAYEELYAIVGVHTEHKIVVYHFPEGHPDAFGGTSNCTIWY